MVFLCRFIYSRITTNRLMFNLIGKHVKLLILSENNWKPADKREKIMLCLRFVSFHSNKTLSRLNSHIFRFMPKVGWKEEWHRMRC